MSDISSNAAAAREAARQDNGKFGAQEHTEAPDTDLTKKRLPDGQAERTVTGADGETVRVVADVSPLGSPGLFVLSASDRQASEARVRRTLEILGQTEMLRHSRITVLLSPVDGRHSGEEVDLAAVEAVLDASQRDNIDPEVVRIAFDEAAGQPSAPRPRMIGGIDLDRAMNLTLRQVDEYEAKVQQERARAAGLALAQVMVDLDVPEHAKLGTIDWVEEPNEDGSYDVDVTAIYDGEGELIDSTVGGKGYSYQAGHVFADGTSWDRFRDDEDLIDTDKVRAWLVSGEWAD